MINEGFSIAFLNFITIPPEFFAYGG